MLKKVAAAAEYIKSHCDTSYTIGIILGTGLGNLVADINITATIPYESIPHFPTSTVEEHAGQLIIGTINDIPIIAMQGRFHFYEGYSLQEIALPIRVLQAIGVKSLIISNICGGLDPNYSVGDLMIIEDHINLLPGSPIIGDNKEDFGPRFTDMYEAYNTDYIHQLINEGNQKGYPIHKGVYVCVSGPQLETPAEYKYLRTIGADVVGMSTVPEVIAARQLGIKVAGISIITDLGIAGKVEPINIPKIIQTANEAQPKLVHLTKHLVQYIHRTP